MAKRDDGLSGHDLLLNWARWTWRGEAVGNMARYYSDVADEDKREPLAWLAEQVERLHAALPIHERMIVIAEYPQRNRRFAGLGEHARNDAARRWIAEVTDVHMAAFQYRLYLALFQNQVERSVR